MNIARWALGAAAAACFLLSEDARADLPVPAYTFETVDAYNVTASSDASYFTVVGVLQGGTAPVTSATLRIYGSAAQACDRILAMMVNRPGRFYISISADNGN